MSIDLHTTLQPEGWKKPVGYANGVMAKGRTIYVGGQIGWNADFEFETDDFVGQLRQTLQNVVGVLAAGGAGPEHLVPMTWYFVDKSLHDALPEHMRPALLLGAFAGLRTGEVVALRVDDVDFMRGVVSPAIQYPAEPLKSETSRTAGADPRAARAGARGLRAALRRAPRWSRTRSAGRPRRGHSSAPCARRRATRGGPARRLPLPRPAALLREPADRLRAPT